MRRRLDTELVRRGLVTSRARAQQAIGAGRVLVSGAPADRPSRLVAASEPIHLSGPPARFVSRGGEKLEAALDRFGIDVAGRRAVDAGASTGGFTDCLLQRGAAEVVAVDVGRGQLAWSLRTDPRVVVLEGCNARFLTVEDTGGPVEVAVADLSFISLALVAPALARVLGGGRPGTREVPDPAEAVFLIKPQFEAGRADVGRGGLVSDPAVHRRVLAGVAGALAEAGLVLVGVMASPLRGASGNIEFLGHFRVSPPGARGVPEVAGARGVPEVVGPGVSPADLDAAVAEGHAA